MSKHFDPKNAVDTGGFAVKEEPAPTRAHLKNLHAIQPAPDKPAEKPQQGDACWTNKNTPVCAP